LTTERFFLRWLLVTKDFKAFDFRAIIGFRCLDNIVCGRLRILCWSTLLLLFFFQRIDCVGERHKFILNVNQRFFIEVTFVWYLDDLGL
jgi:hypothetical protein